MKGKLVVAGAGAVVGLVTMGGVAMAGVEFAPECTDGSAQITQDTSLEDGVADLCTDQNEDELTYAVVDDVTHGTLEFDELTGEFLYTPDAGFVGTDQFTFVADDGFDVGPASADDEASAAFVSEEATFSITVAAQVTTTTSTTAAPTTTTTTAAVAPTSVLARTGSSNATTAGGGFLAIGLGAGLLAASGALVTRARRTS